MVESDQISIPRAHDRTARAQFPCQYEGAIPLFHLNYLTFSFTNTFCSTTFLAVHTRPPRVWNITLGFFTRLMNTGTSPLVAPAHTSLKPNSAIFGISSKLEQEQFQARQNYLEFAGKQDQVRLIRSATDPLHGIDLNRANPLHRPIMDLMDTPAIQRMKKIGQLSTAYWVYPDAV